MSNTKENTQLLINEKFLRYGEVFINFENYETIIACICQKKFKIFKDFVKHTREHLHNNSSYITTEVEFLNGSVLTVEEPTENDSYSESGETVGFSVANNSNIYTDANINYLVDDDDELPTENERINVASLYPYKCTVCFKHFKRKYNLVTHTYTHVDVKPFECDTCFKKFTNKQNLIIHKRRHLGVKPFSCEICDKTFVSSTERQLHMRLHTGDRPYVCEHCGRAHTTKTLLNQHRKRVHFNIRDYKCEQCDKSFKTTSHLRAHVNAKHLQLPKNYTCEVCAATFKTKASLNAHAKIHQEKRYTCSVCFKSFAQHPGLYAHMKSHNKSKNNTIHELEI